jgi:outer membrane scaffolding protein for murein synthesis (MipA/OmpV family)
MRLAYWQVNAQLNGFSARRALLQPSRSFPSELLEDSHLASHFAFDDIQGEQTLVTPVIGATWLSKDTANYYYGTLDEEVARGVVDYKPDAVVIPHVGVGFMRAFGEKRAMVSFLRYSFLPDELKDSPVLEPDSDGIASILIGVQRCFVLGMRNTLS